MSVELAHAQPSGVASTPYSNQVVLTWNAVTGASGYNIYRSTDSGTYPTTPLASVGAVTTYTDTTAQDGETYYYVVKSLSATNVESPASTEVTALPSQWKGIQVTASVGDGEVALGWTPAGGATSYKIYKDTGTGPTLVTTVTPATNADNQYTVTGLTNSTPIDLIIIGYIGGIIVTSPGIITATPVAGGPLGGNGYYNGVDNVTWSWYDNPPFLSANAGGSYRAPLPIAGPEHLMIPSTDRATAGGGGGAFMLRRASSSKVTNWYWATSNEVLYPAPSIEPQFGYRFHSDATAVSAYNGDQAGFRFLLRNDYSGQGHPDGSKEFGGGSADGTGPFSGLQAWTPVFVQPRVRRTFTTSLNISLEAIHNATSSFSSGSARAQAGTSGRFDVVLLNPQAYPYPGP